MGRRWKLQLPICLLHRSIVVEDAIRASLVVDSLLSRKGKQSLQVDCCSPQMTKEAAFLNARAGGDRPLMLNADFHKHPYPLPSHKLLAAKPWSDTPCSILLAEVQLKSYLSTRHTKRGIKLSLQTFIRETNNSLRYDIHKVENRLFFNENNFSWILIKLIEQV